MNLGHVWSHEACPDTLQLVQLYLAWSSSIHSAVRCSFLHVPHTSLLEHSAAKWSAPSNWHLRHLLGSFLILHSQTLLHEMMRPSLIAWFMSSGALNRTMR